MPREFSIRSVHNGTTLSLSDFVPEYGGATSETFLVAIEGQDISVSAQVYGYLAPDLAKFFKELAANWRGWKGEKTWGTLEGEFELVATCDSVGHVTLQYFLRSSDGWEVRGSISLEAGQLEAIARDANIAWNGDKPRLGE